MLQGINLLEAYLVVGVIVGSFAVMYGDFEVKGFPHWIPDWVVVVLAYVILWLPAILWSDGEITWWKRK